MKQKIPVQMYIEELHMLETWTEIDNYLRSKVPRINPYSGNQESIDNYIRSSYQREGFKKALELLGVKL